MSITKEHLEILAVAVISIAALAVTALIIWRGGFVNFKTWLISMSAGSNGQARTKISGIKTRKGDVDIAVSGAGHDLSISDIDAYRSAKIKNATESQDDVRDAGPRH